MKWLLLPLTGLCRLLGGAGWRGRLWNALFLRLLNYAPQIWGGKYGIYLHGRKSRDWLYRQYVDQKTRADHSATLLDDQAVAWAQGMFRFDIEGSVLALQLEQALNDLTHGRESQASMRVREVLHVLKAGSEP